MSRIHRSWVVVAITLASVAATDGSGPSPHVSASSPAYQAATTDTPISTPTATISPPPLPTPTATRIPIPTPTATPTRTPTPKPKPRAYYLALGDSVAYGYQPNFDVFHGYADDFYRYLRARGTRHLLNLACPGETSSTLIRGGCPYSFLVKHPHSGPQLRAALRFIRGHPGQVGPVTITIGANDFLAVFNPGTCTVGPAVPAVLATFDVNFRSILSQLRTALHGSGNLFAMTYYDPYQNECARNPRVLSLMQTANAHISRDEAPIVSVWPRSSRPSAGQGPRICIYAPTAGCAARTTTSIPPGRATPSSRRRSKASLDIRRTK